MHTTLRQHGALPTAQPLSPAAPHRLQASACVGLMLAGLAMAPAWAQAPEPAPVAQTERVVQRQVVVPAGIDAVWAAWTTREGIRSFFAPDAVVEARVGGPFQIHMDPGASAGSRGADDMRFLALQPPRMLSFDWNAPPFLPEARRQRTFVVVRLNALDAGHTQVNLVHSGWGDGGEWDTAHAYFDRAWTEVLGNLKKALRQRSAGLDRLAGAAGAHAGRCRRRPGPRGGCACALTRSSLPSRVGPVWARPAAQRQFRRRQAHPG